jgi:hypothetical protein
VPRNRVLADREGRGDLAVALARGHESNNLQLARRQATGVAVPRPFQARDVLHDALRISAEAREHIGRHRVEKQQGDEVEARLRADDSRVVRSDPRSFAAPTKCSQFWNAGEDEVRFVCEVRPALQFESLLETMFALAADGKTNKKGMPNPFRLAVIARAHFDTVRLPQPPAWLQRAGFILVVLALILLAIPGFAAKAAKRTVRPVLRFA